MASDELYEVNYNYVLFLLLSLGVVVVVVVVVGVVLCYMLFVGCNYIYNTITIWMSIIIILRCDKLNLVNDS